MGRCCARDFSLYLDSILVVKSLSDSLNYRRFEYSATFICHSDRRSGAIAPRFHEGFRLFRNSVERRGFDSPDGFIPWCRRLSRETDVGTTILVSFFRHLVSNIKTFMILSDEKQ